MLYVLGKILASEKKLVDFNMIFYIYFIPYFQQLVLEKRVFSTAKLLKNSSFQSSGKSVQGYCEIYL